MPAGPFPSSPTGSSTSSFEAWVGDDDDETVEDPESGQPLHRLISHDELHERARRLARVARVRWVMLGAACCLSVGSHFGSYILGPIKARLKTSESGFASLVSASQLVNTITPLLSGWLVPKFGAARCGLLATGLVLGGQLVVCWAERGGLEGSVGGMVVGLLVFGLGISPLAVVQESIILAGKAESSKSVARSVAIGLLLGKSASFVAAFVSEPLAAVSVRAPFLFSAGLSAFSFSACVVYAVLERTVDAPKISIVEGHRSMSKPIQIKELPALGDPLWLYIAVCGLAGMWASSIHLSTTLLKTLYDVPAAQAATVSSSIPFSAIVLYPVFGWIIDEYPRKLSTIFLGVSVLMVTGFAGLLFLSPLVPLYVAIAPLAIGIGPAPLLLVVVVPRLVERHHVSTALGIHKSAEMAGAVLVQGVSSWLLSSAGSTKREAASAVVSFFLLLSLAQLALVAVWWRTIRNREDDAGIYGLVPDEARGGGVGDEEDEDEGELAVLPSKGSRSAAETARGKVAVWATASLVVSSWAMFIYNLTRKA